MGPQGCLGGLTGDFGFHSPPPPLWASCSLRSSLCPQQTPAHLPGNPTSSPLQDTPEALPAEGQKRGRKERGKFCFVPSLFLYFNFLTKKFKLLLLIKMIPLFLKSLWYWHLHHVFLRKVTASLSREPDLHQPERHLNVQRNGPKWPVVGTFLRPAGCRGLF